MTVDIRPYAPGDLDALRDAREGKLPPSVEQLAAASWTFTAVRPTGEIMGGGGLLRIDPWRAQAWAIVSRAATAREFVEIRAACLQKIRLGEMDGIHCIEAEVALPFVGGHAFLRGLGFIFAGVCPGRAEDGGCFIRYVRVKDGVERPPLRVEAVLDLASRCLSAALEAALPPNCGSGHNSAASERSERP